MRGKRLTTSTHPIETESAPAESRIRLAVDRVRALRERNYVEDLAIKSETGLGQLTRTRKRLLAGIAAGLFTTALVWITAMSFPYAASKFLWSGFSWQSRLVTILVMSIPFTPPFITVFSISHLMFPSADQPETAVGVMSTFAYRQTSNRRWFIIIVSAIVGLLNCVLLAIALARVTGN
jgi:hypothetical protein